MLKIESLKQICFVFFDFDGVFTDNCVIVSQDGIENVSCCRSDGIGLSRLKEVGVGAMIVSTEKNPVVSKRAAKLSIEVLQGVEHKSAAVLSICKEKGLDVRSVMFVGNDINDIEAFEVVGFPVGVNDCYPEIYPYVMYRTIRDGGKGAVREICDLIYHAKRGLYEQK